jgi:hypothetical protein
MNVRLLETHNSAGYKNTEECEGNEELCERIVRIPSFEKKPFEFEWIREIQNLFQEGLRYEVLENIIIHGSYGDNTHNNYSDMDLTLLLADPVWDDKKKINLCGKWIRNEVYPLLYKVDPLQHHGPFYLWRSLMNCYDNSILPVDVYSDAWSVESTDLLFKTYIPIFKSEFLSLITCEALLNSSEQIFKHGYSLFAMKRFLSNLMLIPSLFFTDIGKGISKAKSFEPFYIKFPEASHAIRTASAIRENWPALTRLHKMAVFFERFVFKSNKYSKIFFYNRRIESQIKNGIIPNLPQLYRVLKNELHGESKAHIGSLPLKTG